MPNNKSPGNDGLTKELYETFRKVIKHPFMNSIMETKKKKRKKEVKYLSTSCRN